MTVDTKSAWWVTDDDLLNYDDGAFADTAAEFGTWEDPDFEVQVAAVADAIYNIHVGRDFNGKFLFSFETDAERSGLHGATVAISLPEQHNLYLMRFLDLKHTTTDRSAIGWNQAMRIKEALLDAFAQVRLVALATAMVIDDKDAEFTP